MSAELGRGPLYWHSCSNFCFTGCLFDELALATTNRYGSFEQRVAHHHSSPGFWKCLGGQHYSSGLPGANDHPHGWSHSSELSATTTLVTTVTCEGQICHRSQPEHLGMGRGMGSSPGLPTCCSLSFLRRNKHLVSCVSWALCYLPFI